MSQRYSSGKHRHRHGAFRLRSLPRTFLSSPNTQKKIRFGFGRRQENLGFVGEPGTGIAMEFSDPENPSAR